MLGGYYGRKVSRGDSCIAAGWSWPEAAGGLQGARPGSFGFVALRLMHSEHPLSFPEFHWAAFVSRSGSKI